MILIVLVLHQKQLLRVKIQNTVLEYRILTLIISYNYFKEQTVKLTEN